MSSVQDSAKRLWVRTSAAFALVRQAGRTYAKWANTSPKKLILNWMTGIAFFLVFEISIDHLNTPMKLEEMSMYEGTLVSFVAAPRRFGVCGDTLVIRSADGEALSFRTYLYASRDQVRYLQDAAIGKPVKIWARDHDYEIWCIPFPRWAHQVVVGDKTMEEYGVREYGFAKHAYEHDFKWQIGIPAFIGLLSLYGLWRVDRRDRRNAAQSIDTQQEE